MGTWYQVLWIPNRFQRQCVADTSATYRLRDDGTIEVVNRCRSDSGGWDQVTGIPARPRAWHGSNPAACSRLDWR